MIFHQNNFPAGLTLSTIQNVWLVGKVCYGHDKSRKFEVCPSQVRVNFLRLFGFIGYFWDLFDRAHCNTCRKLLFFWVPMEWFCREWSFLVGELFWRHGGWTQTMVIEAQTEHTIFSFLMNGGCSAADETRLTKPLRCPGEYKAETKNNYKNDEAQQPFRREHPLAWKLNLISSQ